MNTAPWAVTGVLVLVGSLATVIAPAAAATRGDPDKLEVYVGTLSPERLEDLRAVGLDHLGTAARPGSDGQVEVQVVLSGRQAARLASEGIALRVKQVHGQDASAVLRAQAQDGPTVFRPYGGRGGIRQELASTAARFPQLTKVETIGNSVHGTPIAAIKVTKNARAVPDGRRPAVLYAGAQHGREWITPEMTRRLMHHVLDNYGKDPAITTLLDGTELWFIPVANPDGYDYTFTPDNRLWRKNLRDNDVDGKLTVSDGVDLNRNFPYRWGYDDEGSSPDPAGETYRGPAAGSEPETQALDRLFARVGFEFFVNYHSAAQSLLYGVGWQSGTEFPDDLIYRAMAGDDANPAVPGYDPGLAGESQMVNGDTDTHAAVVRGTLSFTPEMSSCQTVAVSVPGDEWLPENCVSDFVFPDDEELIAAEVAKNLPFALAVAASAKSPDDPVSVVGKQTPDFVIDSFDVSYGGTQPVAVIAKRSLRDLRMHYQINSDPVRVVPVREWSGGERYGDGNDNYYAESRGTVTGARPGDSVQVWFTGTKAVTTPAPALVSSARFDYVVHDDIGGDVLVLAAEDVTGISPTQEGGTANYADEHVAALAAAGYASDVYDIDTMAGAAPHHLGVLSHYRAVVWETGDDIIPRAAGQPGATTTRTAHDTEVAVRDYLNEGGKLLVAGQNALYAQAGNGGYKYRPGPGPECTDPSDPGCVGLLNDFQQYYLGAYSYLNSSVFPLAGRADSALEGWSGLLNAPDSAGNQRHSAALLPTSSFLSPNRFPRFASEIAVDWQRPGAAPYAPYTGSWYVYSGRSNASYQRLTRTVDLRGAQTGRIQFRTSYDVERDWDFLFVEAHEVGTDTWTTLPDANGHTGTSTGRSCGAGWANTLHPFLTHYEDSDCAPMGSTGAWNAATGSSNGWQEWSVDLSAYAGRQVEVAISYAADWETMGLGVFLDDIRVSTGNATVAETSFESDLDGWTAGGPPAGSKSAGSGWARSLSAFDEGSVVLTEDTVYAGFGIEGLATTAREEFVARAMRHLLGGQTPGS